MLPASLISWPGWRILNAFCISSMALCLTALHTAGVVHGQGSRVDYERAHNLRATTQGKVMKTRVEPHWFDAGRQFWYRNDLLEDEREFIRVQADTGKRELAFDHARLATALSAVTGVPQTATRLQIKDLIFGDNPTLRLTIRDTTWSVSLQNYTVTPWKPAEETKLPSDQSPANQATTTPEKQDIPQHRSPDGKWEAFFQKHNLFLRNRMSGEKHALSTDGNADIAYQGPVYWSPDSLKLVACRETKGQKHLVHLIESAPDDQLQPKLHSLDYLKPGDKIPQRFPQLFHVTTRQAVEISNTLFPNPWSIEHVRWSPDSHRFTFLYNQRGHQILRVIAVAADTGETGVLVNEESKTFVDYAYKTFLQFIDTSHELIWMSERNGWNHLYLLDARTGHFKHQITRGDWVVREVERVDSQKRQIWFWAQGIFPEQDPYYKHLCRVNFDGSGFVVLTHGNGTHQIQWSPNMRYFIDTYSRVDRPPISELRRADDGGLVTELERADETALRATGWLHPERFVATGRDGITDIHGIILRPSNFDPLKKYPVIEQIYAGPHDQFVPKEFQDHYRMQELAELGFIVVKIDGMGTNWRSKAFHDVCWQNLGDSGFPDRILWIRAAAAERPWMDLHRVGIYGGSAGGQSSTRAMLAHGDFYHVAVSDCGCHDNRMDKIWWNELWMGWPLGPHYEAQSNVTNARHLQGKLFLIVGELDRNVDPTSTMQVVDALIKADKDFDLLVVPGGGHGIAESRYGTRRRRDYFVRHLLGVEPRHEP